MKKIWNQWVAITKKIARILASLVLTIVFILIVIPISIIIKRFFEQALLGHTISLQKNSFWIKRKKIKYDMFYAREQ